MTSIVIIFIRFAIEKYSFVNRDVMVSVCKAVKRLRFWGPFFYVN
jgi:hypothetical protein